MPFTIVPFVAAAAEIYSRAAALRPINRHTIAWKCNYCSSVRSSPGQCPSCGASDADPVFAPVKTAIDPHELKFKAEDFNLKQQINSLKYQQYLPPHGPSLYSLSGVRCAANERHGLLDESQEQEH